MIKVFDEVFKLYMDCCGWHLWFCHFVLGATSVILWLSGEMFDLTNKPAKPSQNVFGDSNNLIIRPIRWPPWTVVTQFILSLKGVCNFPGFKWTLYDFAHHKMHWLHCIYVHTYAEETKWWNLLFKNTLAYYFSHMLVDFEGLSGRHQQILTL